MPMVTPRVRPTPMPAREPKGQVITLDHPWGIPDKEGKQTKQRDLYYWFGYKLHLVVDVIYELPVSFLLTQANESDTQTDGSIIKEGWR